MAPFTIIDGEHIEEKGLYIIVEGLVVQKELCEEAEVLAEYLASHSINFKDREVPLAVNLIGWWMEPVTLGPVTPEDASALHVLEAELTQVELWQHGILLRVRRGIPCLDFILAKLNHRRGPGIWIKGVTINGASHAVHRTLLCLLEQCKVTIGDSWGQLKRCFLHLFHWFTI